MKPILHVQNLSIQFSKDKKILNNVSFEIFKGQIISLVGLNGTGKTTLLKAIIGLIKTSSGKIDKFKSKIIYIPQKSDLDTSFPLSVKEFCTLFGTKGYEQYLESLDMTRFLKHKISSLSGGEYQRILIAVALSQKPDLLLLDEVTAGVDVTGEEEFYKLILKIREKYGIAILIVSHNIHLVIKNADQVLCLAGHICCSGKPKDIKGDETFNAIFGKYLQPYIHKHDHTH